MPNGQLMEVVKRHLKAGTLPDDVNDEFIGAAIVELYGKVDTIKTCSQKNAQMIKLIIWVGAFLVAGMGGLVFALAQKALGG